MFLLFPKRLNLNNGSLAKSQDQDFFRGKNLVGCFHHWDFARLLFREHLQPAPEPARNISRTNKSEIPPFRCLSGEVLFSRCSKSSVTGEQMEIIWILNI